MNSLVRKWNAFWFPESTGLRLAICRITVVAAQLFFFLPRSTSLHQQLAIVDRAGGEFINPQVLTRLICAVLPPGVFPTHEAILVIYTLAIVSGITTLIGLATRFSAFLFAAANCVMVAHLYSYGEKHHPEAVFCIFLMLLAFCPSGRRLSVDAIWRRRKKPDASRDQSTTQFAVWPLRLTQIILAMAYLCAGLCKLRVSGLRWMNGYTLQHHVFGDAIRWGKPLGVWLAQQHELCIVLSIAAITLEVFFFLAIVTPRIMPLILVSGVLLHVGIDLTQGATFFQLILLYVVFIDFEKRRALRDTPINETTNTAPA